jgi:hypothetical protein
MKWLKLDIQERKFLAGTGAAFCLSLGLCLVAWRKPDALQIAYDTYAWSVVALASAFIGGRVWEKIGLAKQNFVPTPEGSAPVKKDIPTGGKAQ